MSTTRRRTFVAKPSFQIKLTIIFMLMVTIVANMVGGLCFFLMSSTDARDMMARLATHPDNLDGIPVKDLAELLIPKIFVAECISLLIVFVLCIWVTHTIGGPLYRLEKVAAEIGDGDLSIFTRLRPKDELKELADAFNAMTWSLARKLYNVKDALALIEGGKVEQGLSGLRATLDRFRLPSRESLWESVLEDGEGEPPVPKAAFPPAPPMDRPATPVTQATAEPLAVETPQPAVDDDRDEVPPAPAPALPDMVATAPAAPAASDSSAPDAAPQPTARPAEAQPAPAAAPLPQAAPPQAKPADAPRPPQTGNAPQGQGHKKKKRRH